MFQVRIRQAGEPSGEGEPDEGWPGRAKVVKVDKLIYGRPERRFVYSRLLMVCGGVKESLLMHGATRLCKSRTNKPSWLLLHD